MLIWELRGGRRHLVHSKMMAWVAFDRVIKAAERYGLQGPLYDWRRFRETIHGQVCARGFNPQINAFVQAYDSPELDASLLMMPLVGFLPPSDPRIHGTIRAIQQHLTSEDGFVRRYHPGTAADAIPEGEGAFLLCTFWLADNLALMGREQEAAQIFQRLLSIRNDVGLLAEEYDSGSCRMLGNFPQAFSHVALINTAYSFQKAGAAQHRPKA